MDQVRIPGFIGTSKFVDVGTHKLHVVLTDCTSKGSTDEYTIVLEAGGGKYSTAYQEIQETLAERIGVRVMSYDRSGFGQSELGPDDLDAVGQVDTLKTCLEVQGFTGKYILVGHSYGGVLIQLFALRYPERVSGLVLIDPMNCKFVDRFGLDKLSAVTPYFENPTENWQKAGNRMVDFFPQALQVLRGKELPPHIPALLITAGNAPFSPSVWRACHEEMVMHSEKHRLLIAQGCNHDILDEKPELVLNAIIELVNRIQSA
jgi:pimeloyl-ACP methyl ester carboxylesterase